MRPATLPLALAAAAPLLLGQAPVLVPDVSQDAIEIAYSFTGAELLLFGAILDPAGERAGADARTDVAVVVKGPVQSVLVREKARVAGLWVNHETLAYRSAPSFYAVASSRPLERILDARTRAIFELGLGSLQLSPASAAPAEVEARFSQGLVALRQRAGLYYEAAGTVRISNGVLYRASLSIPARVPVGTYTAETFLIRDGRVLTARARTIEIKKSGFERFVAWAAEHAPVAYGLAAVALSVLLGWLAGRIARGR